MNKILKSFDIFLHEPLSILKKSILQIVSISSPALIRSAINVTIEDDKTRINVINNEKVYNLLKTVQRKREKLAAERLKLPESKIRFGSLTLKR